MENIEFSMIVPLYNEAPHLEKSLARLKQVLDKAVRSYEIIMIDDTSRDNTAAIAEKFIGLNNQAGNLALIRHLENRGRGKTVGEGIIAARGEVAGFIDIDFSTSPWYIPALIEEVKNGADVVIGQRIYKLKLKVLHRWILSKGYKFLVRLFLGRDLGDTESGCKFFNRRRIIPVLSLVKDERWFWDTEIIARSAQAGLKISQLPTVFVRESLYTTVKIFNDSLKYFINLIKLRKELGSMAKANK